MSSLASLRTRIERLQLALYEHELKKSAYRANTNTTRLPTADSWPEFAALTYIQTTGTVQPFIPYLYQRDLVASIHAYSNTIVLKSRQLGVSETVASYLACRAATEPGFAAVVFSKTQQDSSNLAKRVRFMLDSIQTHKFKYATDSNTVISIKGGGSLYFLPGSPRAARGIPSGSVLWIDEGAFVEGAEEIYRAAAPVLSMLGEAAKVIVTSTPDIELNWYGSMWHHNTPHDWYSYVAQVRKDPSNGPRYIAELNALLRQIGDDWNRVAIHWSQHPIYGADPNFAEKTKEKRRLTQAAWDCEYELAFGATDTQIYPTPLVQRAARGKLEECGVVNRHYVMGIDPNGGGADYFVTTVIDITTKPYSVVGLYRANGKATPYSLQKTKDLILDFMPDRIAVEKQAMGSVVAEDLQQLVPEYMIELFNTSRPSKNIATDRILYLLERDELIFPDGPIPQELRAFMRTDTGERKAAPGFNDDCVMSLAIAATLIPETVSHSNVFDAL